MNTRNNLVQEVGHVGGDFCPSPFPWINTMRENQMDNAKGRNHVRSLKIVLRRPLYRSTTKSLVTESLSSSGRTSKNKPWPIGPRNAHNGGNLLCGNDLFTMRESDRERVRGGSTNGLIQAMDRRGIGVATPSQYTTQTNSF